MVGRVTALLAPTSYTVDPWDPGYGVALDDDLDGRESTAPLVLDVELPAASWRPVSPSPRPDDDGTLARSVLFLDGVRRIDARVWVHGAAPQPVPGVAASLAAGLVCCSRRTEARIVDVRVDRSLYTSYDAAGDLVTRHAAYTARRTGAGIDELSLAVQRRLSELELELALAWRADGGGAGGDLLVVDGPLRGRTHLPHTVGYVKTHHATYLPQPQVKVVAALSAGQRTPVFVMGTSWQRHSWYLRLPGSAATPWFGVVRLECSADLATADAVALADLTAVLLPPLASTPHKDSRAPQNLVPIGGLERQLRHRLGDAALLYRALRAAA
jgi:hypothetical protein